MPTVAKAPANLDLYTEGQHFVFGDDGTRQVTQEEEAILRNYMANGGPVSIDFEDVKKDTKAKGGKS